MKSTENITSVFWMIFAITTSAIGLYKCANYFDARVAYEGLECADRAYMIYKGYDDQTEDRKTKDWLARIEDCAKVRSAYQVFGK